MLEIQDFNGDEYENEWKERINMLAWAFLKGEISVVESDATGLTDLDEAVIAEFGFDYDDKTFFKDICRISREVMARAIDLRGGSRIPEEIDYKELD